MTLGIAEVLALAVSCAPAIEPAIIAAIVQRESARNPFAIGTGKAARLSHQPTAKEHALHVSAILERAGLHFDVGLGQINSRNLARFGVTVEQALDPCRNMQLMQRVILADYTRALASGRKPGTESTIAALSGYNTGNFKAGVENGYVKGVVNAHAQLKGASSQEGRP